MPGGCATGGISCPKPSSTATPIRLTRRRPSTCCSVRRPTSSFVIAVRRQADGRSRPCSRSLCTAAVVWAAVLRRRVRAQARLYRQLEMDCRRASRDLFDNANDLVFTCNLSGRFTSINRAGGAGHGLSAPRSADDVCDRPGHCQAPQWVLSSGALFGRPASAPQSPS